MKMMKRILAFLFVVAFLLIPLSSCAAQLKLPKEPEVKEEEEKSYGDTLRESIETDPVFPDSPDEDDALNILFVGNSYSVYWPDELVRLLAADGYENVMACSIYHSGASFEDHWTWHENGESAETLHIYKPTQDRVSHSDVNLDYCLTYANWDVISFQQTNAQVGSTYDYRKSISEWLPQLYSYIYAMFPEARYFWQQNWSHEAGVEGYKSMGTVEKMTKWNRDESRRVVNVWGFINVPLGEAWPKVRHDPLFYQIDGEYKNTNPSKSLHTRIQHQGTNKGKIINTDLSHDGDVGGGQYLNGCVWFEMIAEKSVVGNSFVPSYYHEASNTTYTFTAEQVAKLQNAAHEAVSEYHGEEYYKK